jgi:hypothetical protein
MPQPILAAGILTTLIVNPIWVINTRLKLSHTRRLQRPPAGSDAQGVSILPPTTTPPRRLCSVSLDLPLESSKGIADAELLPLLDRCTLPSFYLP